MDLDIIDSPSTLGPTVTVVLPPLLPPPSGGSNSHLLENWKMCQIKYYHPSTPPTPQKYPPDGGVVGVVLTTPPRPSRAGGTFGQITTPTPKLKQLLPRDK